MENKFIYNDTNIDDDKLKHSYQAYMDDIKVDDELHKKLLQVPSTSLQHANRKASIRKFAQIAAGICIVVVSLSLFGSRLIPRGGSNKNSSYNSTTKSGEAACDQIPAANEDSSNQAPKETLYVDSPVIMTMEDDSTYTKFVSRYELSNGNSSENSPSTPKEDMNKYDNISKDAAKSMTKMLKEKLPQGLLNTKFLVDQHIVMQNKAATLDSYYNLALGDRSGRLMVNVHPVFDFEMDLLVSAKDTQSYSLNPKENPSLPSDVSNYSDILLYPIFTADSLTKEAIASRVYTVYNSPRISFGVYQNGYVITYDALGMNASELAKWILQ